MDKLLIVLFCMSVIILSVSPGNAVSQVLNIDFADADITADRMSEVIVLYTFSDKGDVYLCVVDSRGTWFDSKITYNGTSWDLEWNKDLQAVCKVTNTGWIAEIRIPCDEIAPDKNATVMGIDAVSHIARNHGKLFVIVAKIGTALVKEIVVRSLFFGFGRTLLHLVSLIGMSIKIVVMVL